MAKYTPKYGKTAPPKKKRRGKLVPVLTSVALLLAVLAGSMTWGVVAKYAQQRSEDAIAKAKEFYFTSDLLTAEGATYILNPGTESFSFELRNFEGLNVSELDIGFTVSVVSSGDTITLSDAAGTLSCGNKDTKQITLSGLVNGNTYTVTVKGKNGYEQDLSATIVVKEENSGVYKNTNNCGDYVLLTVWTENTSGTLSITIPGGLIPDATDDALTGVSAGGTFDVKLEAYQSRSFRFFTTSDYSGEPITVKNGGNTLDETPLS